MEEKFRQIMDSVNQKNRFLEGSGLKIVQIEQDETLACMDAGPNDLNIYGMVHGGALFSLADMAAGVCALTRTQNVVTLSSSINFVKAAKPGRIYAKAKAVHAGRSTGVYEVSIYGADEILCAKATFTMYFFGKERPHV